MSIYKNNQLIAGGRQCMPLLSFMWADHILNDASWLRASTFSWQPGGVYIAVYAHLTDDITGKTLQSETISGTTIQFYLADDGHKICPASQESNVMAIYNATGVAWYYIIDTTNQRFKLPRTKFGFTGIRTGVGGYVEAGLPNITGTMTAGSWASGFGYDATATGAFYNVNSWGNDADGGGATTKRGIGIDASLSSSIYGNSNTVQPKATEMYLYFYVGQFTQTALENTAGVTTETLNQKADTDLSNLTSVGKATSAHLAMPDRSREYNITLPASGNTITAPEDGYFHIVFSLGQQGYLSVGDNYWQSSAAGAYCGGYVAAKKGQVLWFSYGNYMSTVVSRFVPCVGA